MTPLREKQEEVPIWGDEAIYLSSNNTDSERSRRHPKGGLAQRYKISVTCVGSEGWGQKVNRVADGGF